MVRLAGDVHVGTTFRAAVLEVHAVIVIQTEISNCELLNINFISPYVLSSAAKPGTHFLEDNKITGVFTMLKLCVSKERNM